VAALITVFLAAGGAATAANVDTAKPIARASLVSDTRAIKSGSPFTLALRLEPQAGWHTYWRNPGDAGAPTVIRWRLPPGFSVGPMQWPSPERFVTGPVVSFGYPGEVMLLTELTANGTVPAAGVVIGAEAEWLVCREICIPEAASLEIRLAAGPAGTSADDADRRAIEAARDTLPRPLPWPVTVRADKDHLVLRIGAPQPADVHHAFFYPFEFGAVVPSAGQDVTQDGESLSLTLVRDPSVPKLPDRLAGVVVIDDAAGRRAFEIDAPLIDDRS
jgi:thiol:disulfide interchange protein DsbD